MCLIIHLFSFQIRLLSYLSMVTMVLSYLSMATVFGIRDLVVGVYPHKLVSRESQQYHQKILAIIFLTLPVKKNIQDYISEIRGLVKSKCYRLVRKIFQYLTNKRGEKIENFENGKILAIKLKIVNWPTKKQN